MKHVANSVPATLAGFDGEGVVAELSAMGDVMADPIVMMSEAENSELGARLSSESELRCPGGHCAE